MEEKMDELIEAINSGSGNSFIDYLLIILPIVLSFVAICISISVAKKQNDIAMFELRYQGYITLNNILDFGESLSIVKQPNIVIKSFNMYFSTDIDSDNTVDALISSGRQIRMIQKEVGILCGGLYSKDKDAVNKAVSLLSSIINDAIEGNMETNKIKVFRGICSYIRNNTLPQVAKKIEIK